MAQAGSRPFLKRNIARTITAVYPSWSGIALPARTANHGGVQNHDNPQKQHTKKGKNYFEMYQPVRVSSRIFSGVFRVSRLATIIATTEMTNA